MQTFLEPQSRRTRFLMIHIEICFVPFYSSISSNSGKVDVIGVIRHTHKLDFHFFLTNSISTMCQWYHKKRRICGSDMAQHLLDSPLDIPDVKRWKVFTARRPGCKGTVNTWRDTKKELLHRDTRKLCHVVRKTNSWYKGEKLWMRIWLKTLCDAPIGAQQDNGIFAWIHRKITERQ